MCDEENERMINKDLLYIEYINAIITFNELTIYCGG